MESNKALLPGGGGEIVTLPRTTTAEALSRQATSRFRERWRAECHETKKLPWSNCIWTAS